MKITTYTCICGNRDEFRGGVDRAFLERDGTAPSVFATPLTNAKLPKVLAHQWLPDAEASLWLDGNISLKRPAESLAALLGNADMALFAHSQRDCVFSEFFYSTFDKRYSHEDMRLQVKSYRDRGWPAHAGLWECGVILRRHSAAVADFERRWWAEICRWTPQDQLSFPIAAQGLRIATLPGNILDNEFVEWAQHPNDGFVRNPRRLLLP